MERLRLLVENRRYSKMVQDLRSHNIGGVISTDPEEEGGESAASILHSISGQIRVGVRKGKQCAST